jgi:hypothetical protein
LMVDGKAEPERRPAARVKLRKIEI